MIRYGLVITLAIVIWNGARCGPLINYVYYFTNWALLATFFACLIGCILGNKPNYDHKSSRHLHACHHIMYTLGLLMSPVVVVMYWGLIHEKHLVEIQTKYVDD